MEDDGVDRHGPPKSKSKSTSTTGRPSFRTHYPSFDATTATTPSWKRKLRDSCYKRVIENRAKLLWKIRSPLDHSLNHKEVINSALQDIVSYELKKIKDSSSTDQTGFLKSTHEADSMLWEYDGLHSAYQGECEEILLEMQKIFYGDLNTDSTEKELKTWEDDEDEYLARAVYDHMQLNDEKVWKKEIWCPICKLGELQENHRLIYCTLCKLQLNRGNEEYPKGFLFMAVGLNENAGKKLLSMGCHWRRVFHIWKYKAWLSFVWHHRDCLLDNIFDEDGQFVRSHVPGKSLAQFASE